MKMALILRDMTTQDSTKLVLTVMASTEMENCLTQQDLGIKKTLRKVQNLKRSFLRQVCFMNVMATIPMVLKAQGDIVMAKYEDRSMMTESWID